jgi:hypothetical protein
VTITSPPACAKPAASAAALPKFLRRRTTRAFVVRAWSRVRAANDPSVEPSSTNTTSQARSSGSSALATSS